MVSKNLVSCSVAFYIYHLLINTYIIYVYTAFHLPEFIHKTGITEIRNAVAEDEEKKTIRQKNRQRVAPKMGGIDVDYRVLHDAFFKYQTIPPLTKFGDLYYEGKEFEVQKLSSSSAKNSLSQPGKISEKLREALGMADAITTPPPW